MAPDHLLDDDEEQDERPAFSWRELLARILPYYGRHRFRLLLAVVLLLAVIGLGLMAPLVLGQVIDLATRSVRPGGRPLWIPVSPDRDGLMVLAGLFMAVVVLGFLMEAALGFLMSRVGIAIVIQLKEDLFRKVMTLDPGFFRDYPPGKLIARVESDTESLKDLFSTTALLVLRATLSLLGILGAMLLFDAETTLTVLPLLLGLTGLTVFFVKYIRRFFHRSRRYLALITGHITEYVQGIEVVQHFDYAPQAEERLDELQRARLRADVTADFLNYGFWGLFAMGEIVAAALVLWVGIGKVVAGVMTIGTLVIFLEYLRQVFLPLQMLSEFVAHIQRGFVSAGRIFGILALEPAVPDAPDARADASLSQGLQFEDVAFRYENGAQALRGVSFEIPRGKKVALVGASGGGKSTIVKLLLRFHEPQAGRITLDGEALDTWTRAAWRSVVGVVPQDVFLFPGTLRENITVFDPDRPRAEVEATCRLVQADRLLRLLPQGLEGQLAERGANLSHGERQLVSLARALVHDPALLVLDEATSSVDTETEALIQASLERLLAGGRTALIVAHRLSTIRRCDEILVVEEGQIVERGTHDELWARGGAYRSLAELQFADEAEE